MRLGELAARYARPLHRQTDLDPAFGSPSARWGFRANLMEIAISNQAYPFLESATLRKEDEYFTR